MIKYVQIRVFLSQEAEKSGKPVFERILNVPSSLSVDYNVLESAFIVLFGRNCIINYKTTFV